MLNEKFDKALCLASRLHRDQRRKATDIPYISHLMAVSSMVIEACDQVPEFDREDLAIAALLHDTLEDQGHKITLDEIEEQFGSLVARIVDDCSDTVIETEGQEKPPWKGRKLAYIDKISGKRRETLLVSCADKLHNARSILNDLNRIGPKVWKRFNAKEQKVRWYYREMAQEMRKAWPENPLIDEFSDTVCQIDNWKPRENT
jgi:(p)ppGpp synthase/HD superfamily hydrolase